MVVADQDTLRERFRAIGGDWLAKKLTPMFAERAGKNLIEPHGVDNAVELALHEVLDGTPQSVAIAIQMAKDDIKQALRAEA